MLASEHHQTVKHHQTVEIQRTVEVQQHAQRTVVSVQGEIDLATVADLEDALCEVCLTADGRVEVDLAGVTHLSCRGMAALASTRDGLAARGIDLVLRHPEQTIRRILRLVGLEAVCDPAPHDDSPDAVRVAERR